MKFVMRIQAECVQKTTELFSKLHFTNHRGCYAKKHLISILLVICFVTTFLVVPAIAAPAIDSPEIDVATPTSTQIPRADSWNKITYYRSLPASIYSIVPSCNDSAHLYAITNLAIYYSLDDGKSWIEFETSSLLTPKPTVSLDSQQNNVQLTPIPEENFSYYLNTYSVSCEKSTGYLYIGTPNGILRINLNDHTLKLITSDGGLPSPAEVAEIVFSHTQPSTGYASVWRKGIYRTSDWGNTWSLITGEDFIQTDEFALSTSTPETLYALTLNLKLYRSTDQGNSWDVVTMNGLPPSSRVFQLIVDSNTSDLIIWVKTYIYKDTNSFFKWLSSLDTPDYESVGIYRSKDNGINWYPAFNGIDNSKLITSLVGKSNSAIPLFVTTSESGVIYRSDDLGNSWEQESLSLLASTTVTAINVSDNQIIIGTKSGELFVSEDDGKSWYSKYASVPEGLSVFQVVTSPAEKDHVYLGTSKGIYLVSDGGKTWLSLNNGITSINIASLAINPINPRELFAGTSSGEIFRSITGGNQWSKVWNEAENAGVGILYFDKDSNLFAGTDNGILLQSIDGGENWIPIDLPARMHLHQMIQDSNDTGWIYIAADAAGLLLSKDNGQSWQAINQLGQNYIDQVFAKAVAVDNLRPGRIYIALYGGKLYRSDNYAKEWVNITSPLFKDEEILKILVEPDRVIVLTTNNIFVSNDDGDNWKSIIYGFPQFTRFLTIAPDLNNTDNFYVGTQTDGLFTGKIGEITGAASTVGYFSTSVANTLNWNLRTVTIVFVIGSIVIAFFFRKLIKFFVSALLSPINILFHPSKVKVGHGLAFFIISGFLFNAIFSTPAFYYPPYTYPLVFWGYKLLPNFPIELGFNIYPIFWINSVIAFFLLLFLALEYTLSSFVATKKPKADSFLLSLSFFLIYYQIGNFIIQTIYKLGDPGPFPTLQFQNTITTISWAIVVGIYLLGFVFSLKYCGSLQAWGWFPIAPIYTALQWVKPTLEFLLGLPWKPAVIQLLKGVTNPTVLIQEIKTSRFKTGDQLGFYLFVSLLVATLSAFIGTVFRFVIQGLELRIGIIGAVIDSAVLIFDLFTFVFLIEWVAQLFNQNQDIQYQRNPREIARYEILLQALLLILPGIYFLRNLVCYVEIIVLMILENTGLGSVNVLNRIINITFELAYLLKFLYLFLIVRNIYFPHKVPLGRAIKINFKKIITLYRELFLDLFDSKRIKYYSNDISSFLQLNALYGLTLFLRFALDFAKLSALPSSININIWIDTYLLVAFLGFAIFIYLRFYPEFNFLEIANPILMGLMSSTVLICIMLTLEEFLSWSFGDIPYLCGIMAYISLAGIYIIIIYTIRKLPIRYSKSWQTLDHLPPALIFMTGIPMLIAFSNSIGTAFLRKTKIPMFFWTDMIFYCLSIYHLSQKGKFLTETQRLHSAERTYQKLIYTAKDALSSMINNFPANTLETTYDDFTYLKSSIIKLITDFLISTWVNISKLNLDLSLQQISQELKVDLSHEPDLTNSNSPETKGEVCKQAGVKALSQILDANQMLSYKNISYLLKLGIPASLFYELAYYTREEKVSKIVKAFADLFSYEPQA